MTRPQGGARRPLLASPCNRDASRSLRCLRRSAVLGAVLACPVAWGAQWDIVPTLSVVESYTDNIALTSDALKQSDWITQAIPGIKVNATGPRLRFNVNYAPEVVYYAHSRDDVEVFNRGSALGTAELARQLLFIDGGAAVNQYDVSPRGPLTTSNINITGNRATVANYFASPYLRSTAGSQVQAEARYTYSVAKSDDTPELVDSAGNAISLRLASGPAYKVFTWNLSYHRENIEYTGTQQDQDTDIEVSSAGVRRMLTNTFALTAQGGYDYYKRGALVPASEGWAWNVGMDWTPSPRTRLAAAVGERFYGDYYSLEFTHRTPLTTWSAGYNQTVTTTRSEFFLPSTTSTAAYLDTLFSTQIPDPVARQKAVENFIARTGLPPSLASPINFFTTQLFVTKRWQASVGILGVRNVVIANVFNEDRDGLAGDLVLPNSPNATNQTGTSLSWNWRMTPVNTLNASGAYIRIETPFLSQVDRYSYAGLSLTRQFQPKLTGALGYRRQQNDPEFGSGYTENVGFASIHMRF
jgi:uncharacterized protein (PEP-CTERM system associated)